MIRNITQTMVTDFFKEGTVMAWDPSITAWGWVILTWDGSIIDCGCIKTVPEGKKSRIRKSDDRCRRITEINIKLIALLQKYNVQLIVSEIQHGSQSAVAATMLGITLGISQTISDCLEIAFETWSEGDSKLNLLGKRSAGKEETIDAIDKLYWVKWTHTKYIDEAIADAVSIFHIARKTSSIIKFHNK
jgi:Holliday junction resolvasome RuvABC endonuclease subunit